VTRTRADLSERLETSPYETLSSIPVAPIVGRERPMVASPLDGRYGPMHPDILDRSVQRLLDLVDLRGVDHVLGIPEGGIIPAFAVGSAAGRSVALASIWRPDLPGVVTFVEEHDGVLGPKHVYGVKRGARVLIVEDEVTTGRTVINCVRALRQAGIECDQVATVLFLGDEDTHQRLREAGIHVHSAMSADVGARQVPIG